MRVFVFCKWAAATSLVPSIRQRYPVENQEGSKNGKASYAWQSPLCVNCGKLVGTGLYGMDKQG